MIWPQKCIVINRHCWVLIEPDVYSQHDQSNGNWAGIRDISTTKPLGVVCWLGNKIGSRVLWLAGGLDWILFLCASKNVSQSNYPASTFTCVVCAERGQSSVRLNKVLAFKGTTEIRQNLTDPWRKRRGPPTFLHQSNSLKRGGSFQALSKFPGAIGEAGTPGLWLSFILFNPSSVFFCCFVFLLRNFVRRQGKESRWWTQTEIETTSTWATSWRWWRLWPEARRRGLLERQPPGQSWQRMLLWWIWNIEIDLL